MVLKLTDHVKLRGRIIKAGERYVNSYTGIPYAYRSTLLVASKELVYPTENVEIDATKAGAVCPRSETSSAPLLMKDVIDVLSDNGGAVEDALECASLDVYAPVTLARGKQNVVIYVHGGGLNSGSRFQALNRADNIHRFDELSETIWVNVGYSLGPLGFWAFRDETGSVQANAAIYEIIRAIKWVHDYIDKFGGDKNDITLIGHSAGAALVQTIHFMLRNPAKFGFTRQPFHKLVVMSGSSYLFKPVSIDDALARQKVVIDKTPCKGLASREQDACIKGLDGKSIIDATRGDRRASCRERVSSPV